MPAKGPGLRSVRKAHKVVKQREGIRDRVYAESNYLAAVVDADRKAVISSKSTEIFDFAILPKNRAKLFYAHQRIDHTVSRTTGDLPACIDRDGFAALDTWKCAQVC